MIATVSEGNTPQKLFSVVEVTTLRNILNIICRFAEPVELGSGDGEAAATAKFEIRRGPFASGFSRSKRHLLLLGGGKAASETGLDGLREGRGILLLPLKLSACSVWLGDQVSKMLAVREARRISAATDIA